MQTRNKNFGTIYNVEEVKNHIFCLYVEKSMSDELDKLCKKWGGGLVNLRSSNACPSNCICMPLKVDYSKWENLHKDICESFGFIIHDDKDREELKCELKMISSGKMPNDIN